MHAKLKSLFGWSALLGLLALPVILFLAIVAHGNIVSGKQVTFDRARASLSAALTDARTDHESKRYGYFEIHTATTNPIVVDGRSYPLAFYTDAEYQFRHQGRLAVTTNRQFIWLDNHRGAKLISDDYKVSQWQAGY